MKSIVVRVTLRTLRIPLPVPVFLGDIRIEAREFAVAVIETADGLRGWGATFTRGAPIAAVARHCFVPLLLGKDALSTRERWQEMFNAAFLYGQEGIAARAISILDIALWDLKAKHAGLPLHRLLGSSTDRLPLLVPVGYRRKGEDSSALFKEAEFCQRSGVAAIKFMFPPGQLAQHADIISKIREKLGPQIILGNDFFYQGHDAPRVLKALASVAEAKLDFIEDPFPTHQKADFTALHAGWPGGLFTGELCSASQPAREIMDLPGLTAARWDATVCGGITSWLKMHSWAAARGIEVHPHCAPEIHAHLLAAKGTKWVETSLPEYETIHFSAVLTPSLSIQSGVCHLSESPGLGINFDEDKAEPFIIP